MFSSVYYSLPLFLYIPAGTVDITAEGLEIYFVVML